MDLEIKFFESKNEKLNNLYRAADVFISPSTGCNGPHVILEALFNDLPVVGFNQGVAQDSIIHNINGYLVPCFNRILFGESIYKALYSNDFNFEHKKNKKIKSIFNSSYEAEAISKHANNDININLL
jgi:glycosyltransferase involved in cell wall biosynthesis